VKAALRPTPVSEDDLGVWNSAPINVKRTWQIQLY